MITEREVESLRAERARYRDALERIVEHWNGEDGEIDPVLMANIARNALA